MRVPVPDLIPPVDQLRRVHFVGIGGAALSGLARLMVAHGVQVTGSDARDSAMLASLRMLGIPCFVGHRAEQLGDADTVVVSTAIREDNPEVRAARSAGLRLWPRAAAVQSLLLGSTAVVVTGTHGKTTTTSMLVTALLAGGADPSYAIGSTLNASGLNAARGADPLFVTEGDESDGAILAYTPAGAVITNVDADHLDIYGTEAAYAAVFDEFLTRIEPGGFLVACVDDPGAARLAGLGVELGLDVISVGQRRDCTVRVTGMRFAGESSTFAVSGPGGELGAVTLQVPGVAYVLDAAAALAAGLRLGYGFDELAAGLAEFRGSGRRMEAKGSASGVSVYDSYAHHPTEIRGDLEAGRSIAGAGRLIVCFQPHLYSRTRAFGAAMGHALGAADAVLVMDVYAAREDADPEISGATVAAAIPLYADRVRYEPDRDKVPAALAAMAGPGDLVMTLGAGDVTEIGPLLLAELRRTRGDSA